MSSQDRQNTVVLGIGLAAAAAVGATLYTIRKRGSSRLNKLTLIYPPPEDVVISQSVELTPIADLFKAKFGLGPRDLFSHGLYKGKLNLGIYDR